MGQLTCSSDNHWTRSRQVVKRITDEGRLDCFWNKSLFRAKASQYILTYILARTTNNNTETNSHVLQVSHLLIFFFSLPIGTARSFFIYISHVYLSSDWFEFFGFFWFPLLGEDASISETVPVNNPMFR